MSDIKKLSLVIPCYNEEENIRNLYEEIAAVMTEAGVDFELVLVNDGSGDNTINIMSEIAQTTPYCVKVVDFSRNFGKEAAMYAGLSHACGEYTVIVDGDMQQSPQTVLNMLDFLEENPSYDCVAAVQEKRREGCLISFFKRCFYAIINRAASVRFVSGASDFRMMRRPVVDAILSMCEYFRFSKGIFSYVGFNTYYMPYEVRPRGGGKSKFNFFKLLRYAFDGINSFSTWPLKFATVTGVISALAAFAYLIVVVIQRLTGSIGSIPGYATIVVLILLLGGLQLLSIGIIGDYVGKNYVETKKRPVYIVRKVIESSEVKEKNEGEKQ